MSENKRSEDIEYVEKMLNEIIREMRDGFKGVHKRQDISNGRMLKAESEINALKVQDATISQQILSTQSMISHVEKDSKSESRGAILTERVLWFMLTALSSIIVYFISK